MLKKSANKIKGEHGRRTTEDQESGKKSWRESAVIGDMEEWRRK